MPKWIRDLEQFVLDNILVGGPGCWPWTGSVNRQGYGQVKHKGKQYLAHRLVSSYFEEIAIENLGESVRHTCDNPICVRPSHLINGTQQDNHKDMLVKGRNSSGGHLTKGADNGHAVLCDYDVDIVWEMILACEDNHTIALKLGVHHTTISQIRNGIIWKHKPPPSILPRWNGRRWVMGSKPDRRAGTASKAA